MQTKSGSRPSVSWRICSASRREAARSCSPLMYLVVYYNLLITHSENNKLAVSYSGGRLFFTVVCSTKVQK